MNGLPARFGSSVRLGPTALEVVAALSFQDCIGLGVEIVRTAERLQWYLGDLALHVETGYGTEALQRWAEAIGVSYETAKVYRWVASQFEKVTRVTNLSHRHHLVVAHREDRLALLAQAAQEGWSVRELKLHTHGRLSAQWGGHPPFSVLDARQGSWQERKRGWFARGIRGGDGRPDGLLNLGNLCQQPERYGRHMPGSSVFDPVLAELMYVWFCPPGGHVLDPFAGGSTRGLVASFLGLQYRGVELRQEQVLANLEQALEVAPLPMPTWVCGDSSRLGDHLPQGETYDLIFTSPPYYDLEMYSDDPQDGSAFGTYREFLAWYGKIFDQAVARLKEHRFLVVQVGEIRDREGNYRGFVADTERLFRDLGLRFYNEAVLVTPVGSMPLRAGQFEKSRKLVKGHQNLLVFLKGEPWAIASNFPNLAAAEHGHVGDGNQDPG